MIQTVKSKIGSIRDSITSPQALGAGITASIVSANLTASKVAMFDLPLVGSATIPAGFVGIGATFLFSDLLSELHGKEVAHKTVTSAVGALALAYGFVYASVMMPSAPFYHNASEFASVMMASEPIIAASLLTTTVSQNLDVSIFHNIREKTGEGHKYLRNIFSTVISQAVDTTLFILLGFVALPMVFGGTSTPLSVALGMIVAQYVVKLGLAAIDTPLFYAFSN